MRLILTFGSMFLLFTSNCQDMLRLDNEAFLIYEIIEFSKENHELDTCTTINDRKYICTIDSGIYYGTPIDLSLPKNEFSSLFLSKNGVKINLLNEGMYNPNFSGKLHLSQFRIKNIKHGLILYAYFSGGEGAYTVHWTIHGESVFKVLMSREEEDFLWQLNE